MNSENRGREICEEGMGMIFAEDNESLMSMVETILKPQFCSSLVREDGWILGMELSRRNQFRLCVDFVKGILVHEIIKNARHVVQGPDA